MVPVVEKLMLSADGNRMPVFESPTVVIDGAPAVPASNTVAPFIARFVKAAASLIPANPALMSNWVDSKSLVSTTCDVTPTR